VACKVERVSRPVWHCPGLTRNGPGDPFYMGRRTCGGRDCVGGGIREIKSHPCKSVFFFRYSRRLFSTPPTAGRWHLRADLVGPRISRISRMGENGRPLEDLRMGG